MIPSEHLMSKVAGWGKTHAARVSILEASDNQCLNVAFDERPLIPMISRGLGRSYGDMATMDGGTIVDITSMTAIDGFDDSTGIVVCGSGATIRDLVAEFLPRGFAPPTCPGTGFVTIGGAIANDVHGKNHDTDGSFGHHLEWIELVTPRDGLVRVSPSENVELFNATVGGAGLTGIIVRAAVRLRRVPSNAVIVRKVVIESLEEFIDALSEPQGVPYSVGWINISSSRRTSGRGVLQLADYAGESVPERKIGYFSMPEWLQLPLVNKASSTVFNVLYHRASRFGSDKPVYYPIFTFPLDRVSNWNNFYGRAGVYQFQCVIDFDRAREAYRKILDLTANEGMVSPLAVLKNFGAASSGMLSFPRPGITLAIDLPATARSAQLISRLYDLVIDYGGRVYLAKDALLTPRQFEAMYPNLDAFRQVLGDVDPEARIQSDMSRRIGIHA